MMDKEMQRALEADGEKLRALTGEDHGPVEDWPPDEPDFCIIHGYEHMRTDRGVIAYCTKCEEERAELRRLNRERP